MPQDFLANCNLAKSIVLCQTKMVVDEVSLNPLICTVPKNLIRALHGNKVML